jgi:hypothetical protein
VVSASVRIAGVSGLLLLLACKPNLDQTVSIVGGPTVLAVRSDPPEGALTSKVQYTALYVDGAGPIDKAAFDWAFCSARNPLANLGPVNPKCLEATGSWLTPIGVGLQASGPLPADGCRQFGPDVPEPMPGEPQGRPVDPDSTGGYYQPVRYLAPGDSGGFVGIAETRLTCNLAGAYGNVVVEFSKRYHVNANPVVDAVLLSPGDNPAAGTPLVGGDAGAGDAGAGGAGGTGAGNAVAAGAHVSLRVRWAACPVKDSCGDHVCGADETLQGCPADCTNPVACTGAERFAAFDLASQSVVDQRESIAVAWFATRGSFDNDRTGRESSDVTSSSDNGWTAPTQRGLVYLWVVLRDDRGGVGWAQYAIDVH